MGGDSKCISGLREFYEDSSIEFSNDDVAEKTMESYEKMSIEMVIAMEFGGEVFWIPVTKRLGNGKDGG